MITFLAIFWRICVCKEVLKNWFWDDFCEGMRKWYITFYKFYNWFPVWFRQGKVHWNSLYMGRACKVFLPLDTVIVKTFFKTQIGMGGPELGDQDKCNTWDHVFSLESKYGKIEKRRMGARSSLDDSERSKLKFWKTYMKQCRNYCDLCIETSLFIYIFL